MEEKTKRHRENKNCRIANIIILMLGVISLFYGIILLAIIGTGSWFNFVFAGLGIFLILIGLFFGRIVKTVSKWNRIFVTVCLSLIFLLFLNFVLFEGTIITKANQEPDFSEEAPRYVIVLGAKVDEDCLPSLEFSKRLIKAEELCNKQSTLILTGGKGTDEPISEAEGAYNYLIKRGRISAGEILLETKSTSTSENLEYALGLIREKGGDSDDSVMIISSAFHLFRASRLALFAGYSNTSYAGSTGLRILQPYYYLREYAAYVREIVL